MSRILRDSLRSFFLVGLVEPAVQAEPARGTTLRRWCAGTRRREGDRRAVVGEVLVPCLLRPGPGWRALVDAGDP